MKKLGKGDLSAGFDQMNHVAHKEVTAMVSHPVGCIDCHMPYKREGGMKISDHHARSPLLNINRACQGCHHFSEEEMKTRVETIQNQFFESRNVAMDALVQLIGDTKARKEA